MSVNILRRKCHLSQILFRTWNYAIHRKSCLEHRIIPITGIVVVGVVTVIVVGVGFR